jgi:hypothetical protein
VNGKVMTLGCEHLSQPVFSPDGSKLLLTAVEFGTCYRKVIPVQKLLG